MTNKKNFSCKNISEPETVTELGRAMCVQLVTGNVVHRYSSAPRKLEADVPNAPEHILRSLRNYSRLFRARASFVNRMNLAWERALHEAIKDIGELKENKIQLFCGTLRGEIQGREIINISLVGADLNAIVAAIAQEYNEVVTEDLKELVEELGVSYRQFERTVWSSVEIQKL